MVAFEQALAAMKRGKRVKNRGFPNWLTLDRGEIYHSSESFRYLPWVPSQYDILSNEWEIENEVHPE